MAEIVKSLRPDFILGSQRTKAIEHILNVVVYDNFMCQCIRTHVNFESGYLSFTLPHDVTIEKIADLSMGYGKGSDNTLPEKIIGTLKSHPGSVAIFDDVMAEPGDSFLHGLYVENNNEIYHYIPEAGAAALNVRRLVVETAVSWHFLCVIVKMGKNISLIDCITHAHCEALITSVVEIIVGAFDGEGYIHWHPHHIRP